MRSPSDPVSDDSQSFDTKSPHSGQARVGAFSFPVTRVPDRHEGPRGYIARPCRILMMPASLFLSVTTPRSATCLRYSL